MESHMAKPVVTPIHQIDRRMAEAGRIRMGRKTAKAMTYLETFRFTSPDRDQLDQIAAMYGGEVKPWHDQRASPKDQFEVVVNDKRIDVILPPDCLDQWYELWAGSGCQRRCDGAICQTPMPTRDGYDMAEVDCMCLANKHRECEPYTRLKVILPGVDFRGVWRLQTKGWNALHELPGMVDVVESMAAQGRIISAQLSIAKVERMVNKRKSHFVVPKLEIPFTPEAIVSGDANLHQLASPDTTMKVPSLPPAPVDDGIIEAEVVPELEIEMHEVAEHYGVDPRQLYLAVAAQADHDEARIQVAIAKMKDGTLEPDGFDPNGRVIWRKR